MGPPKKDDGKKGTKISIHFVSNDDDGDLLCLFAWFAKRRSLKKFF